MSLFGDSGDGHEMHVRRVGIGTLRERVVVSHAPAHLAIAETLATFLLSGHAFGVRVSDGRRISFGSPGEGDGVVTYEIHPPSTLGICMAERVRNPGPREYLTVKY